jgi:5-methylcytosine-specific restriction endonuclease McrA
VVEHKRPSTLTCEHCSTAFPRPDRAGRPPRYCSEDCRVVASKAKAQAYHAMKMASVRAERGPRLCEICGTDISDRQLQARFCGSACSYASRGHEPRVRVSREEKLARRRARRARTRPPTRPCVCEECGIGFEMPSGRTGRKLRWCDECREIKAPTRERRTEPVPCLGCDNRVPLERGPLALYCSRDCQIRTSQEIFMGRAKLRRLEAKAGRLCEECDAPIPVTEHGIRRFCESHDMRRARLAGVPSYRVSDRELNRLIDRYRRSCAYCGEGDASLHLDHVVPIARGGSNGIGNLLPACRDCNLSKNDRFVMEWRLSRKSPRYERRRRDVVLAV